MKCYSNTPIIGELLLYFIVTNKYDMIYSPSLNKFGVMKRHFLWSNKLFRYLKKANRKYIMITDSSLVFQILPHIEELVNCQKFMSNKLINNKIERLIKLRAFM